MSKNPNPNPKNYFEEIFDGNNLEQDIHRHIISTMGNDYSPPRKDTYYNGLAYTVRDRLLQKWFEAQRTYYNKDKKRVYYLSLEFLPGRFLKNYIVNLKIEKECRDALKTCGYSLEELEEQEMDAGLGNGGLGRLASCFMDSMACLKIPAYGYGIRYDYGIFIQKIVNGYQVEECDNWLRNGNPWEIKHVGYAYPVQFYGRSEACTDENGRIKFRWVDTDNIDAVPCDVLIPGYGNGNVINMRLWAATSSHEFDLSYFNHGDYMKAMEEKIMSENISKVLYPSDQMESGRELRLKQQYFFVAATFRDILRRFKKHSQDFRLLPEHVAIQLNDTHPSIAIAELMRILVDEESVGWDEAWEICRNTFAYTNHTVMPEALETWPVGLFERLLPRHLQIIYEINARFLDDVRKKHPGDNDKLARLSLIAESPEKRIRMAHLAIVGSHSVNGVAALHSEILKESLFREFHEFFPGRFLNVTNGITPRRWLLQANPTLSKLITETIGDKWINDLDQLQKLAAFTKDTAFMARWREIKKENKRRLADHIFARTNIQVDPESLFDTHVKRIHEYKRQLLNVLRVVTLYFRMISSPHSPFVPRTVIFGGKAAPGYALAKLIIKLINAVAEKTNNDPVIAGRLKVVFIPNYSVSQAEKIIPGTDLSEQISTAGTEASGTSNMKFALNGSLTIGTLDGANIEIMEEVGEENFFIFGLKKNEVAELKASGYNPWRYYENDPELKQAIDVIAGGFFSPEKTDLFLPIKQTLLDNGDKYLLLADYRSYIETQERVAALFRKPEEWAVKSVLNTARMGKFSSDRSIAEYAKNIWGILSE